MSYSKLLKNDLSRILTLLRKYYGEIPKLSHPSVGPSKGNGPTQLKLLRSSSKMQGRTFKHVRTFSFSYFHKKHWEDYNNRKETNEATAAKKQRIQ